MPRDSEVAIKLARSRLAKGQSQRAIALVETVLERNDLPRPKALALKIEIYY
ncbi:MAG: hypothetical protein KGY41_09655 [Desulfovermiculus sp.]|nr:hypothetical protein [Desulfovermiculus sp.]